jgi:hypothetical protein
MFSCLGIDLNEEQRRRPFSILQRLLLLKSLRKQSNQVRFLQSEVNVAPNESWQKNSFEAKSFRSSKARFDDWKLLQRGEKVY